MSLKWNDTLEIAIQLSEKYPDEDVQYIRFTDLHRYVTQLEEFSDDPNQIHRKTIRSDSNGLARRTRLSSMLDCSSY